MVDTDSTAITLSDLLPGSFLLAYTIPLLLLSVVVTFAGAFLTLDRTRSFPPIDKPVFKGSNPIWRMEGGVGGLMAGWLCGMHLSTYLSLLILNRSSMKLLSGIDFLVIWALVSAPLAAIGSRWRIAACVFYCIVGGASLTALIDIIFLPKSLLPRLIIYAIFTPLLLLGTLLPMPIVRHATLRTCSALTGSAGIVVSIALFSKVPSWTNPWLTLAIAPYVGPVDSKEKGLSAALCVLAVGGAAVDWLLKTKLGEDPDKEWDAYLARYSKQLPLSSERAGSFAPLPSFWDRIFERRTNPKEMVFPPDSQLLPTHSNTPSKLENEKARLFAGTTPPSFRPYPPTRKRTALTKSPKFGGHALSSSDEDDSDNDEKSGGGPPKFKPWLMKRTSTGHTTLVGEMGALVPPPKLGATVEEYSDVEQDLTTLAVTKEEDRNSPGWKPAFIRKHESQASRKSTNDPPPKFPDSPTPTRQVTVDALPPMPMPTPIGVVPSTPSLIQAVNRITRAQQDAVASPLQQDASRPPTQRKQSSLELDDGFWNKVRAQAGDVV